MKKFGAFFFTILVIYFIFLIRQDIIDNLDLKREKAAVEAELISEKNLAGRLLERLKDLRTNNYIEELARTRLGLIKKGEIPYKVIDQGVK